jgi:hypothetical protein
MDEYKKSWRPLVELQIENSKTGGTRNVVVLEGLLLWNLHRVVQYSFIKKEGPITLLQANHFSNFT